MAVSKKVAKPVAAAAPVAPVAAVAAPVVAAPVVAAPAVAAPVAAAPAAEVAASPVVALSEMMKPLTQMPETFRANAEQGLEKARAQYAALKGNAESMTEKLEESLTAAQSGARVFNGKVVDLFRAQVDAGFAHLNALFNVTSVSEAIKLQQEYSKAQVEALQAQSKDLADFAKQVGEQVVEPVKATIALPFKAA
jgi:phasin